MGICRHIKFYRYVYLHFSFVNIPDICIIVLEMYLTCDKKIISNLSPISKNLPLITQKSFNL